MKKTLFELKQVIRQIINEELDLSNEELEAMIDDATQVRHPAAEFPLEVFNAMEDAKERYLESTGKEDSRVLCTYYVSADGQYYIIVISNPWTRQTVTLDVDQAYFFTGDGTQVDELEV